MLLDVEGVSFEVVRGLATTISCLFTTRTHGIDYHENRYDLSEIYSTFWVEIVINGASAHDRSRIGYIFCSASQVTTF